MLASGKDVFVTNSSDNVLKIDKESLDYNRLTVEDGMPSVLQGIAVDKFTEELLVCDSDNRCIRSITPTGRLINTIPIYRTTGHQSTSDPEDVCFLRNGQAAVLESTGKISFLKERM